MPQSVALARHFPRDISLFDSAGLLTRTLYTCHAPTAITHMQPSGSGPLLAVAEGAQVCFCPPLVGESEGGRRMKAPGGGGFGVRWW